MSAEAHAILNETELNELTDKIIRELKTVFDPEIPVDVFELGLIYKIDIDDDMKVATQSWVPGSALRAAPE